jgi:ribosomal protein L32
MNRIAGPRRWRPFGSIEDRSGVDEPGYEPPLPEPDEDFESEGDAVEYVINPLGVGLAALGGAIIALASFLPLDEPSGPFSRVQTNTLIQNGGWWLTAAGATIIAAAVSSYIAKRRTRGVFLLIGLAAVLVVYFATDKSIRTLYPIGTNGELNESANGTLVPLGIAVYVAGAGVLLAFVGAWMMRPTLQHVTASDAATKQCPDCAETVLAGARVCKHCGYRFDQVGLATGPSDA